jgi:CRISPR-associated protein Csm2
MKKDKNSKNQGQNQGQKQDEEKHEHEYTKEIAKKIREGQSLASVLKPEEFAKPCGYAEKIVEELGNKLKTSQLRKIFTEIKNIYEAQKKKTASSKDESKKDESKDEKIKDEIKVRIYLLYPKLAYAKGRGLMPDAFYELLNACLDKLVEKGSKEEDFESFFQFITAIVAYSKKHENDKGGKGNAVRRC